MLGDGRINTPGFYTTEQIMDTDEYFKELASRGIYMKAVLTTNVTEK